MGVWKLKELLAPYSLPVTPGHRGFWDDHRHSLSYRPNSSSPIPVGVSHLAEDFILFKTRNHCSQPGLASSNPRIICDIYSLLWDVAGIVCGSFVLQSLFILLALILSTNGPISVLCIQMSQRTVWWIKRTIFRYRTLFAEFVLLTHLCQPEVWHPIWHWVLFLPSCALNMLITL